MDLSRTFLVEVRVMISKERVLSFTFNPCLRPCNTWGRWDRLCPSFASTSFVRTVPSPTPTGSSRTTPEVRGKGGLGSKGRANFTISRLRSRNLRYLVRKGASVTDVPTTQSIIQGVRSKDYSSYIPLLIVRRKRACVVQTFKITKETTRFRLILQFPMNHRVGGGVKPKVPSFCPLWSLYFHPFV